MTIRTRLIILTIMGLAMTMAIWGWIQIRALDRILVDQHGRRLSGLAETVSQFYVQFPTDAGLSALDNTLRESLMQDSRLARLDIFSLGDGWLDHIAGASRIYFEWPEQTLAAARKKFQIHYVRVETENGPALGLLYPIIPDRDQNTYVGILSYSRSYSEILAKAKQLLFASSGALILIILVIFILGYRYLVDMPLRLITKTIGGIEKGSYGERIPIIRQDEWGRLAGHINSMAVKIEQVITSNQELNISLEHRIAEATHKVVQLQTELNQLQKLNALGYLTANLAHDMGTPLHSIAGLARLLLEQNGLPADQRRKLELIVQQTERLNAIISNVRKATRLPEPEFEYLCVSELLVETKALIEPLMTQKGIMLADTDGPFQSPRKRR
ncbi:MAG: histidine kinase dimerization/phospho-acceptor domain-containing protein [Smithellaceae bacterium]|nr:histidine kinase dimerization/phospho-acceptor domain-containing protein [Smithellaceae bacterium]